MNQVTLTGNLCRDFELRQTATGTYIASSALAVRTSKKNEDGSYLSNFFDIRVFGKQTDYATKYCRKGDKLAVSGEVFIRDFVNRDGVKMRAVEVNVSTIENLSPKREDAATEEAPSEPTGSNLDAIDLPDDDLPF